MTNRRIPFYPDDSDYNTNAPSYYDDLARKSKLIQLLAKRIWEYENTLNETLEQIEKRLTDYITENDSLMNERLENWDQRIEEMPEEMRSLFVTWLNDGTLEQIINHDVLGNKADQSELDKTNEQLAQTKGKIGDENSRGQEPQNLNRALVGRGVDIKDFGAKGNANFYDTMSKTFYEDREYTIIANDDTLAIKAAYAYAKTFRIGKLLITKGNFLVSDTTKINNRAVTIIGLNTHDSKIIVAPDFANSTQSKPVFLIADDNQQALDKIHVSQIGFDARADNMNTRGIQFEFLIYSSGFEYLDFEQFSGAVLYSAGLSSDVSEMITINQIRAQPRGKVRVEPTFNIRRMNEAVLTNNRFFAKEHRATTPTPEPLLHLEGCMGIDIRSQNSFFYADEAPAIRVISDSDSPVTQGVFIGTNTFEKCDYVNTIEIIGKGSGSSLASTDIDIQRNRYNSTVGRITLTNVINALVMDMGARIVLNGATDGCTIFYNKSYGLSVTNNTTNQRNTIINVGGEYNTSQLGLDDDTSEAKLISGIRPGIRLKMPNNTQSFIDFRASTQYSDFNNANMELRFGSTVSETFTAQGLKHKIVNDLPQPSGLWRGVIVLHNENNTDVPYICIRVNGEAVWRKLIQ